MTLEQFKRFVDAINKYYAREEELAQSFESFNSSYTIIEFCPEITNSIYEYIMEYFNDKNDWFSFWFFELEQGKQWNENTCCDENKQIIYLRNVEEIYDFLIQNKR